MPKPVASRACPNKDGARVRLYSPSILKAACWHKTDQPRGAVAGLVEIECGVVSGVINLESSGVEAPDWRPRHDKQYHAA